MAQNKTLKIGVVVKTKKCVERERERGTELNFPTLRVGEELYQFKLFSVTKTKTNSQCTLAYQPNKKKGT